MAAHVQPGEGMFVCALRRRLDEAGLAVPFGEHDLLQELGVRARAGGARAMIPESG